MAETPLTCARDGLCVAIRLTPLAKADRRLAVAEGRQVVKAGVTAPAATGHANEALLPLLARAWWLYRRDLAIRAGTTSRHKRVRVAGGPGPLRDRLGALISAFPGR